MESHNVQIKLNVTDHHCATWQLDQELLDPTYWVI